MIKIKPRSNANKAKKVHSRTLLLTRLTRKVSRLVVQDSLACKTKGNRYSEKRLYLVFITKGNEVNKTKTVLCLFHY